MGKRYFEKKDEFCVINALIDTYNEGYTIIVTSGKVGTKGEEYETEYASEEEWHKALEKLIDEKIEEGFVENLKIDFYTLMGVHNKNDVKVDEELFSDKNIKVIEKELGQKIPKLYIELMKIKNGNDEWYRIGDEILDMTGFEGLDKLVDMKNSIEDWGYPNIGIYFAWTESAGHEALVLNYVDCMEEGVPSVWLLDQECEHGRLLAKNFDDFIKQIYFEDFESRYEKEVLEHFKEFCDKNDRTILKEFLADWGYKYSEDEDED